MTSYSPCKCEFKKCGCLHCKIWETIIAYYASQGNVGKDGDGTIDGGEILFNIARIAAAMIGNAGDNDDAIEAAHRNFGELIADLINDGEFVELERVDSTIVYAQALH